ncbi:indole-3-glycerol phosphate synthase TrpC [soil metagenome]
MENILERILRQRRIAVAREFAGADLELLCSRAELARSGIAPHRFRAALPAGEGMHIIGEFKRSSPSAGVIRDDLQPQDVARTYERAGASAMSVLTEPEFFGGSLDDLRAARAAARLPILRKDFIVHEAQIYEAAIAGADAVLLIVAALTDGELLRFRAAAQKVELDTLVEVHTAEEMRRAAAAGAEIIGVNNRDLTTLRVSLDTSLQLASAAPADALLISESGITSAAEVEGLAAAGYRACLVGESLMRAADPASLVAELRGAGRKAAAVV